MAKRYLGDKLSEYCVKILSSVGLSEMDAMYVAQSLVRAELEGAKSHGISRLGIYMKRLREGRINCRPQLQFEQVGALVKVDGDNGLGQVVASRALQYAFPLTKKFGVTAVFIRNSNHFGTAAYYCQQACETENAIIAMTNSPAGIAPWGGKHPFFGTNPIAFGFPVKAGPPIIIDMSSSVVARGRILMAEKLGEKIPFGWALDERGQPTDDPKAALTGSVLPIGGVKGYALALAVELFSAIMTGAHYGPYVSNLYEEGDERANVGHSFILFDLNALIGLERYYARMDEFIRSLKQVPRAQDHQEIVYPGERRYRTYKQNVVEGIELSGPIEAELIRLGESVGVDFHQFMRRERTNQ